MSANTSNPEESVLYPMPRRSTRLMIKREKARKQAEEELKKRVELQLVERLDQQLLQQRQKRYVRRVSQRMDQQMELQLFPAQNIQVVGMSKPRQKRKRIPDQNQEQKREPVPRQEQSQIQAHRCVCAEINGEYYKLYDLPDKADR